MATTKKQTARGKAQDKRTTSKKTLTATRANIAKWKKAPNRIDIKGIDTKKVKKTVKAKTPNAKPRTASNEKYIAEAKRLVRVDFEDVSTPYLKTVHTKLLKFKGTMTRVIGGDSYKFHRGAIMKAVNDSKTELDKRNQPKSKYGKVTRIEIQVRESSNPASVIVHGFAHTDQGYIALIGYESGKGARENAQTRKAYKAGVYKRMWNRHVGNTLKDSDIQFKKVTQNQNVAWYK